MWYYEGGIRIEPDWNVKSFGGKYNRCYHVLE